MFTTTSKTNAKRGVSPTISSDVVDITTRNRANVSKHRFIGREHRSALYEAWRNGRASLMKLVRSNTGLKQLDIEAAILAELDERERRLKNNLLMFESRTDNSTGPFPIGGAMRPHHFGGGMLSAIGRKAA